MALSLQPRQRSDGPKRQRISDFVNRNDRYFLPAPAVALTVILLIFPVLFTLVMSFFSWSGGLKPPQFIGFDNYLKSLQDERFWGGVIRTGYFVGLAVALQIVLGVAAALVFHKKFFARGIARSLFLFPMIATPAAIALVWKMMLDPTLGVVSFLVEAIGGPKVTMISDANLAIPALALVDTWQWTPLVMLIVLAGLAALPEEPYEAAKLDGAGEIRILFSITLPLLRPVIATALMFRLIDCIKTFDIIMIITNGGPGTSSETLNLYSFNQSLTFLHIGYGSALLVWLGIMVFAIAMILTALRRKGGTAA
jgi:multiple sugar transport system permease protein